MKKHILFLFATFLYSTLSAQSSLITFQVDMSFQIDEGNFDANTSTMSLAGTMNDWDATATPMLDTDSDKIYSVTLYLHEGDVHNFKFVMNGSGWESIPVREYTVPNSADTIRAYFDVEYGAPITTEITIYFSVDMELEIAARRFDTDSTVTARGSFNGWSDVTPLSPSLSNQYIYKGSAKYDTFEGDIIYYKYAYTSENGINWEINPPTNSGNYEQIVTVDDITNLNMIVPVRGYNSINIFPPYLHETVIRFIVDMNGAVDTNGIVFPSIDNVFIVGGSPPLAWPSAGWPDSDSSIVIFLADNRTNGDSIAGDNFWTKEITFPIYSPFDIEYKYGANWGLASNGGTNNNESGFSKNHHILIPTSEPFWSGDAVDVFGIMETKYVVNTVKQSANEIPLVYVLEQNYPNPFNPSTIINFSIPESGLVTLKVFNILGQEVAVLLNEVKSVGNYAVSFDANSTSTFEQPLTSGVYIYKLQTSTFSVSKKMILIK